MLEKATIARPYAEAAFAQALEEGQLNEWSGFLDKLRLIITDENMRGVLHHPQLSHEQLAQFIIDICGEGLSQTQSNFVSLLVEAERIQLADELCALFEQKKAAVEGISDVHVISAFALDQSQIDTISQAVAKRLGKQVEIQTEEDKELIGGVIIRSGDAVVDASVRGRLKELTNIFAQ